MSRLRFEDAACAALPVDEMDRVFFATNPALIDKAKRICAECPIKAQCLEAALSDERGVAADMRFGVFAGTTPTERAELDPGRFCKDCDAPVEGTAFRCPECRVLRHRVVQARHSQRRRLAA